MAKLLKLRRGTDTQHSSFTGAEGEVTVNTTNDSLHVHDGTTAGGRELMRADKDNMPASGVTAGTYGSASAIPAITVDAKGLVTSATTSAIDSTSISNGTSNVSVAASGNITVTQAGNEKLRADGNGIVVTGRADISGDLTMGGELNIIGGSDANKYLDVRLGSSAFVVRGTSGGDTGHETLAQFERNGSASLFYDNNQKLLTTSTGIDVTGTVTCDGMTSDDNIVVNSAFGTVFIRDSNSSGDAAQSQIAYRDSANAELGQIGYTDSSNRNLYINNNQSTDIRFMTANTDRLILNGNGTALYPNANNTMDLGGSGNQFKDGYFDGTVYCDGLTSEGNISIQVPSGSGLTIKDTDSSGNSSANYIEGRDSANTQKWYLGDINADGDLYVRNQQAGTIYFGTNSGNKVAISNSGHLLPTANNSYDLGDSSNRWRNVYTNDLNLSNEGGTNDVDGTWGSWTIQEGEDDLFLLNRRNGKKYKFNLSEVN